MRAPQTISALLGALTHPSPEHGVLFSASARRWLRLLPYLLAIGATAALLPTGIAVLHNDHGLAPALAGGLAVGQAVPLLLSVSRPLPAWWIVAAADLLTGVLVAFEDRASQTGWPWSVPGIVGYTLLMVPLALRERRRTLYAVWLATAAGCLGLTFFFSGADHGPNNSLLVLALSGVVLLLVGSLRERAEAQRKLTEQEAISETERAQRTLLEERARIARELHDVVAHHMSVITVQADSAPYRLTGLPPEAVEEFGSIAAAARGSLTEMRRLLGVLRGADSDAPEKLPQPGLTDLPGLVETVAQAGVRAELNVTAEVTALGELPPAVGLSTYRIVQEALANVVRHAPGAQVWVSLAAEDETLRITVVNTVGAGGPAVETAGTGHGLTGMRERVRLLGGRLDTGPLPEGGFRVAAVLPLEHLGEPSA
ncbi:sensor histidine kinase [Kitasatospora sp. MMS16-BH015]|uniref:sensor histidine kinase n=1 Tax=Kitasatospora sp. MMS16-BH015 TaxID=2018025 RepID=UPI000CA3C2AD|nr:sensor histidine kinase [Kitasatospora sp. MMS16-BH015]AUG77061.1 sensor histidine kinase [Kitasatospora sp. MMS16-BH015]